MRCLKPGVRTVSDGTKMVLMLAVVIIGLTLAFFAIGGR